MSSDVCFSVNSDCLISCGLRGEAERVGAVQPGDEKAAGRPYSSLPVPEGACRKDGDYVFSKACCNRIRCNDFRLREGRLRLDIRKKFL